MLEHLWLPCMATVAAIALSAIVFKEFLKKRAGQSAVKGSARSCPSPRVEETATDYEVFLSFRGPDTRSGFTDYLYTSLTGAGIRTFKDDKDLPIGEEFDRELPQAINQSKISIPIFSKNYAASVWCLKELAQMVKCRENGSQKIMPIFYDVEPSEVRYQNQTKGYAKALRSHKKKGRHDEDTIREWKAALSAVGAINGWDLHGKTDRREGEFAKEVTDQVFRELKKAYLAISDCLVSVDNQEDEIKEMIGTQRSETRIIGIHGMGGIGKTTVAKIIYNQLSSNFKDCCCFLANIREMSERGDIKCLQKQLISDILKEHMEINNVDEGTGIIKDRLRNKKVLLLLDDVEKASHIDAFVGKHDWFGRGSKIIITTRNKYILCFPKVDCSYELKCMDPVQSLKLFSKHAFKLDSPLDEDMNQSNRAINIAKGLPLALEVIGSLLCHTKRENWDDKLMELENVPPGDIQQKLEISYNALPEREKHIFLDIACLFIGYEKDIVIYFWNKPTFFSKGAMDVLENMSLMKIDDDNKVWMHDQLRDLGREIVRRESNLNIEKQRRVWDPKEALGLLRSQKDKKKLEALRLDLDHQHRFTYEDFKRLPNLRFLEVCCSKETFHAEERLFWHESTSSVLPTNVFQENSDLLQQLRWLAWHDIPPTFKITNLSMEDVVILDLSGSKITHDWKGWSHMKVMNNLKVMKLTNCIKIKELPDSIGSLESLIKLDISSTVIKELPDFIGNLKSLIELNISESEIKELPDSIGSLLSLNKLNISESEIKELPDFIGNLELLIELDISRTGIEELPDSIGNLKSLNMLNLIGTGIKKLPDSIGNLESLIWLYLSESDIEKLPDALWTIETLEVFEAMFLCRFNGEIGNCIYRNRSLKILNLKYGKIYAVPRLPESLIQLNLCNLYMDTFPDLSNLTNLKKLGLTFVQCDSDGESEGPVEEDPMPLRIGSLHGEPDGEFDGPVEKDLPRWIGNLSKLESLILGSPYVTALPTDISLLPQLKSLGLQCPNLRCLPSLPSSLSTLDLESECVAALPTDMSRVLPRLKSLSLTCPNLRCLSSLPSSLRYLVLQKYKSGGSMEGEDLSNLKTLRSLDIYGCAFSEIRGLDRLENREQLRLTIVDCGNLVEIQGGLPPSLYELRIEGCGSLQKLPDLSSLKELREVYIRGCCKLNVEAISSFCSEKGVEFKGDKTNQREKTAHLDANSDMDLREKTDR